MVVLQSVTCLATVNLSKSLSLKQITFPRWKVQVAMSDKSKKVVFHPPPTKMVEEYAQAVCRQITQDKQTETLTGFTSFIKLVVTIAVKQKNS